jgi:hypothetical protein
MVIKESVTSLFPKNYNQGTNLITAIEDAIKTTQQLKYQIETRSSSFGKISSLRRVLEKNIDYVNNALNIFLDFIAQSNIILDATTLALRQNTVLASIATKNALEAFATADLLLHKLANKNLIEAQKTSRQLVLADAVSSLAITNYFGAILNEPNLGCANGNCSSPLSQQIIQSETDLGSFVQQVVSPNIGSLKKFLEDASNPLFVAKIFRDEFLAPQKETETTKVNAIFSLLAQNNLTNNGLNLARNSVKSADLCLLSAFDLAIYIQDWVLLTTTATVTSSSDDCGSNKKNSFIEVNAWIQLENQIEAVADVLNPYQNISRFLGKI